MILFDATYKCRLCGELFVDSSTGNENLVTDAIFELLTKDKYFPKGCGIGVHRYVTHHCPDGSWEWLIFKDLREKIVNKSYTHKILFI